MYMEITALYAEITPAVNHAHVAADVTKTDDSAHDHK